MPLECFSPQRCLSDSSDASAYYVGESVCSWVSTEYCHGNLVLLFRPIVGTVCLMIASGHVHLSNYYGQCGGSVYFRSHGMQIDVHPFIILKHFGNLTH